MCIQVVGSSLGYADPAVVTVTEDAEHQAQRLQKDKQDEAEWLVQHITQDPELQQEWIREDNLAYGGLIAIGIVLMQPFVAGASLDTAGMICAVAFAIAIPLLAALVLVNRQEMFRRRRTSSRTVAVARSTAQACAFVGVVAGFWHIHWIAGVGVLVSALAAVGVQSAGITRLELAERPAPSPRKQPRSPRSPATPRRRSAPRRRHQQHRQPVPTPTVL
jgi:Trk-type K+ transport system membrane component